MTYRTDDPHAVEDDLYEVGDEEPRRGLLSWILIVALLAGTGSGSAMIWRTFGGGPSEVKPTPGPISTGGAPPQLTR